MGDAEQIIVRALPEIAEVDAGASAERTRLLGERRNQATVAWLDRVRDELEASGQLVYDLSQLQ